MARREAARSLALEVLRAVSEPAGIAGAAPRGPDPDSELAHYRAVWARDAMIAGLAGLVEPELLTALDASLRTLIGAMDPSGQVPMSVVPATGEVRWQGTGGHPATDATSWVLIAACLRWLVAPDDAFLADLRGVPMPPPGRHGVPLRPALDRMADYLLTREETHEHLPIAQPRSTWVDLLYLGEGRLLHLAVLHARALALYAAVLARSGGPPDRVAAFAQRAAATRRAILATFQLEEPVRWPATPALHELPREQARVTVGRLPYLLASRGQYDEFLPHCDVPSNLLAYLWGITDRSAALRFFDFALAAGLAEPYPIRVLEPPILPGSPYWRGSNVWRGLNLAPYHYHNGGAWPWVGGLWVEFCVRLRRDLQTAGEWPDEPAARRAAERAGDPAFAPGELERLAAAVLGGADGRIPCPEWLHGLTGRAQGMERQSWTAGRFLVAAAAVDQPEHPCFAWWWGWPALPL